MRRASAYSVFAIAFGLALFALALTMALAQSSDGDVTGKDDCIVFPDGTEFCIPTPPPTATPIPPCDGDLRYLFGIWVCVPTPKPPTATPTPEPTATPTPLPTATPTPIPTATPTPKPTPTPEPTLPPPPTATYTPTPVPPPALGAPRITRHDPGPASISLTWTAGANATSYRVQQYNYGVFVTIGTTTGLRHTVTGFQDRDERRHRVCSVRGGETACSGEVRTRPGATPTPVPPLSAPANFKATGSGTSITLTWSTVTGAGGYEIEENDAFACGQGQGNGNGASGDGDSVRGACDGWSHLTYKGAGDTSHTVTGLTPGLTYSYRIRSYRTRSGDHSPYSYAEATPPTPTTLAVSITAASSPVTEGQEVRFNLTANPAPASNLDVNVAVSDPGSFVTTDPLPTVITIATNGKAELILTTEDDGVDEANGTVTATIQTGTGYQSERLTSSASVTVLDNDTPAAEPTATPTPTPAPLAKPTGLISTSYGTGGITLVWNEVSGIDSYEVQQSDSGQWRRLPFGDFTLNGHRSAAGIGTVTITKGRAVIRGLTPQVWYQYRVIARKQNQTASSDSYSTLVALPNVGLQADHTVAYVIDRALPLDTLDIAAAAWNSAVSSSPPNVRFCEKDAPGCAMKNSDGGLVFVIKGNETACGDSTACVGVTYFGETLYLSNMTLTIEDPPEEYNKRAREKRVYLWTTNPDDHFKELGPDTQGRTVYLMYLPMMLMHELGHTAGLHDLYDFPELGSFTSYLMGDLFETGVVATVIPSWDSAYLRGVYQNHTPRAVPTPTP